ncbi:MAG: IS630 family transposase [Planctomycetaceae bacterium]
MRPYSLDLRERVAAAVDHAEGSLRQIARRFRVSLSFVVRLLRRRHQTDSLDPKPHGGGHPPALDSAGLERLRDLVKKQPDATLDELRQRVGVACSRMALWRALRKLKITRKKKSLPARERDTPENRCKREAFREKMAGVDPRRLVFVDETGATTALRRTYGRAPRGERVVGTVPGRWESVTLISALRLSGVAAPLAFEGATDTPAFQTYVEQALAPQLAPGDVVIWDNLKPHKDAHVKQAVERTGARVEALPPYSSDLTPIEGMWSKAKGFLRSVAARTTDTLYDAMGAALRAVDPEDIVGWFRSCGWCGGAWVEVPGTRAFYQLQGPPPL